MQDFEQDPLNLDGAAGEETLLPEMGWQTPERYLFKSCVVTRDADTATRFTVRRSSSTYEVSMVNGAMRWVDYIRTSVTRERVAEHGRQVNAKHILEIIEAAKAFEKATVRRAKATSWQNRVIKPWGVTWAVRRADGEVLRRNFATIDEAIAWSADHPDTAIRPYWWPSSIRWGSDWDKARAMCKLYATSPEDALAWIQTRSGGSSYKLNNIFTYEP